MSASRTRQQTTGEFVRDVVGMTWQAWMALPDGDRLALMAQHGDVDVTPEAVERTRAIFNQPAGPARLAAFHAALAASKATK